MSHFWIPLPRAAPNQGRPSKHAQTVPACQSASPFATIFRHSPPSNSTPLIPPLGPSFGHPSDLLSPPQSLSHPIPIPSPSPRFRRGLLTAPHTSRTKKRPQSSNLPICPNLLAHGTERGEGGRPNPLRPPPALQQLLSPRPGPETTRYRRRYFSPLCGPKALKRPRPYLLTACPGGESLVANQIYSSTACATRFRPPKLTKLTKESCQLSSHSLSELILALRTHSPTHPLAPN